MKPATRKSLRGRLASGTAHVAMILGGWTGTGEAGGYKAGRRDNRKLRSWRPGEGSPATDLLPDLPTLRGRSRDLERNHPIARGGIQTKVNGVVGTGLMLKSVIDAKVLELSNEQAIELQYQIEREFELWAAGCDFAGQLHFSDLQRLAYRSARVSGDIGIVRRFERRPGNPYGTKLVLVEADRISNPDRAADTPTLQGGVSLDTMGRILGYSFSNRHPGDLLSGPALSWTYVPRVSAKSGLPLMLLFTSELMRPGQVRGEPLFAPVEEALKMIGDYSDAEVHAAVNDALLFAFEMLGATDGDEPLVATPEDGKSVAGDNEVQLEDLTITTLANGSSVQVKKPERPNSAFGDFVNAFLQYVGTALEIPFELLIMHFSSSFSASRAALEIAWKGFEVDQARLARGLLDPVREWQFAEMVASGRFEAPGFFDDPIKRAAWLGRQWIGPTRIQINPQVEAAADKIDMQMGVKSRDQVITQRTGGDFDRKSAQILHERGVLGDAAAVGTAAAGQASAAKPATKNNDGTDGGNDAADQ